MLLKLSKNNNEFNAYINMFIMTVLTLAFDPILYERITLCTYRILYTNCRFVHIALRVVAISIFSRFFFRIVNFYFYIV